MGEEWSFTDDRLCFVHGREADVGIKTQLKTPSSKPALIPAQMQGAYHLSELPR